VCSKGCEGLGAEIDSRLEEVRQQKWRERKGRARVS